MGIGVSILLMAVGAVLAFAVHVYGHGFDINTIGVILMVVGGIGLLTAIMIGGGPWTGFRRTTYVDDGMVDPAAGRRVVRETHYR